MGVNYWLSGHQTSKGIQGVSLEELRPIPLAEQAEANLRRRIVSGDWAIGTKIPGETTLAAELGVGRSTVREAVRALAAAGMVRPRQGVGVFVISATPRTELTDAISRAAIIDLYEVRAILEVEAVKLAAERRTDGDVDSLKLALQARRKAATGSDQEFVDADIALHAAVVRAAQNPVLTALFTEFIPTLRAGLIELVEVSGIRQKDPNTGDRAHSDLVGAILDGAVETAAVILHDELRATLADLRKSGLSSELKP